MCGCTSARVWVRKCVGVRVRECVGARVRECVGARVRECAGARVCGCASAGVRACASVRVRECTSARVRDHADARMRGSQACGCWVRGWVGAQMHVCASARGYGRLMRMLQLQHQLQTHTNDATKTKAVTQWAWQTSCEIVPKLVNVLHLPTRQRPQTGHGIQSCQACAHVVPLA